MVAAEDVQRQEAVTVVITVEEVAQLMTMNRIVGGVEIQHDPLGRSLVLGQKGIHEELMDRLQMGGNLLVPMLRVSTDRR